MIRLVLLFLFSMSVNAQTLSLCAYYNWSPWMYAEKGTYNGILIEQLNLFKETYPEITIQMVEIHNWKRCQLEVERGNVSMILGANKTEERSKTFDYLPIPSFINKASVGAFALENKFKPVSSLEGLKNLSLSFARGDSFGKELDEFISGLAVEQVSVTNSIYQSIEMVARERVDYFLSVETSHQTTLREYKRKFKPVQDVHFQKLFSQQRAIPVYIVFGKGTGNYEKYAEKWIKVIKAYQQKVDLDERFIFHVKKSGN